MAPPYAYKQVAGSRLRATQDARANGGDRSLILDALDIGEPQ
jgi:hypothetical protein